MFLNSNVLQSETNSTINHQNEEVKQEVERTKNLDKEVGDKLHDFNNADGQISDINGVEQSQFLESEDQNILEDKPSEQE